MDWLNYHHLLYFRTVVREGGVGAAARKLHLTPQTISAQVRELEERLGEELLDRSARTVRPTAAGELVFEYAERIFSTGEAMLEAVRGRGRHPVRVAVGVSDGLPKTLVARVLAPLLTLETPVRLHVADDTPDRLAAALAVQQYDFVLSDVPAPPALRVRAFSHLLGETKVAFVAAKSLAEKLRRGFPGSLEDAPLVLPTQGTALRGLLDRWFEERGIMPRIVAEVADSALAKAMARDGTGAAVVPSVSLDEASRIHRLSFIGEPDGVVERFYVVSTERRVKHPAVAAVIAAARADVFASREDTES